jgi:hypothetical protein
VYIRAQADSRGCVSWASSSPVSVSATGVAHAAVAVAVALRAGVGVGAITTAVGVAPASSVAGTAYRRIGYTHARQVCERKG